MKTYCVNLTKYYSYVIDAESEERAEELAEDEFASDPYAYEDDYTEIVPLAEEEE